MELTHQLREPLKQLRLSGILATLEARHRQAIDGKWSYIEFLSRLLEDEVERCAQKQLALRVRRAALTTTKTLEGFDFSFNPSINRQQILALASGDYIRQKRNVLMCGPSGVGKPTHAIPSRINHSAPAGPIHITAAALSAQARLTYISDTTRPMTASSSMVPASGPSVISHNKRRQTRAVVIPSVNSNRRANG
jgi:IstB-like ATP binding protein